MVSCLLPTRARPKYARRAIESLGEGVEILMYVDSDDPYVMEYTRMDQDVLIINERVAYAGMHTMVNLLAEQASCDWLLLWNDDVVMRTPDWTTLLPTADKPELLNIYDSNPNENLFPLMSRSMYDAMGHFSLSAHCDTYVQQIANTLGIHTYVPGITVDHLRDEFNDDTTKSSQSAWAETQPKFFGDVVQGYITVDVHKVSACL